MQKASVIDGYESLHYSRQELAAVMRRTYDRIIAFVTTPAFQSVVAEMGALPVTQRPQFVQSVLLDDEALAARGVEVPSDMLIQRSAFGDRRPTLFVVKKFLPDEYSDVWQNVNITFDNEFLDEAVSRDPELCWRPPLPVPAQSDAMSAGLTLEQL